MDYRLDIGMWNEIFAVPCALVDRHLKLAGKEQLQVLLWLLRYPGKAVSPQKMAEALGMSQDSALDALEYWCGQGLLALAGETLSPVPVGEEPLKGPQPEPRPAAAPQEPPAPEAAPSPAPAPLPPPKRIIRPDGEHLAARMAESQEVRFLMREAETTLGKTLSPAMSSLLVSITDDYGMPPEVTVMLLHYAAEIGRTGTSYIDSVARNWAQEGVLTVELAEEKLRALTRTRQAWSRVSAAAGISKRSPSKTEAERAGRWVYEWNFTDEMLTAAYDLCAEHTGKFSAAYMDKILTEWHERGIRNLQELEEARAQAEAEEAKETGKSYDIDQLASMSSLDLPEDL